MHLHQNTISRTDHGSPGKSLVMSVRFSLCSLTAVCRNQMYMGKKHDEHEVIDKMSTAGHNSWCYSMDRQSKQRNSDDQSKAGESELHFAGDSQVHASSPQVSSTAETPSCSVASNSDCNNHVRDHGRTAAANVRAWNPRRRRQEMPSNSGVAFSPSSVFRCIWNKLSRFSSALPFPSCRLSSK